MSTAGLGVTPGSRREGQEVRPGRRVCATAGHRSEQPSEGPVPGGYEVEACRMHLKQVDQGSKGERIYLPALASHWPVSTSRGLAPRPLLG